MSDISPIRLLVIDDNRAIHDDIRKSLQPLRSAGQSAAAAALFGAVERQPQVAGFTIDSAYQGAAGWQMACEARDAGDPYRVAFVDVRMPPGWDGIETTEKLFSSDPDLQVVICTAFSDYSISDILKRFGRTDRLLILRKPFDVAEVTLLAHTLGEKWRLTREDRERIRSQDRTILDMERLLATVQDMQQQLADRSAHLSDELRDRDAALWDTRQIAALALAHLAESRDPETGAHLQRMQRFAQLLAEQLSRCGPYRDQIDDAFLEDFRRSTPLHDVGKVGVPDSVLLKPGRLTTQEFAVMKRHTEIGAGALLSVAETPNGEFLKMAAAIARSHHENFDGTGYPDGLRGQAIPLAARIAAVADVFDAMTSARVYKEAIPVEEARQFIREASGSKFDPAVVNAFEACFDEIVSAKQEVDAVSEANHLTPLVQSSC